MKEEKLLIALIIVFWSFLFLTTVSKNYSYFSRSDLPVEMGYILFEAFLIWIIAALFAPAFIRFARRYPIEGDIAFLHTNIHVALSILIVPVYAMLFEISMFYAHNYLTVEVRHLAWNWSTFWASYIIAIRWLGILGPVVYWLVVGSYHLKRYYELYKQRELKNMKMEAELASIRLHVLKIQLHPHFLFNTLHNVHSLIQEDVDTAEEMLDLLKQFLQMSIRRVNDQQVPLREEIKFTDIYLEIEQIRFSNRLTIEKAIDPDTLNAYVPSLMLQPLVENAIRHGVSKKINAGIIKIISQKMGASLRLTVEDNGPGLKGAVNASGVGLKNINQRLEHLYQRPVFELDSSSLGGLKVQIEIPLQSVKQNWVKQ